MAAAARKLLVEPFRGDTRDGGAPLTPSRMETASESLRSQGGEPALAERRGPMRPGSLTPTRRRLRQWTLRAIFRLGDGVVVLGAAWVAGWTSHGFSPGGPSSAMSLLVGTTLLCWSLGAIDAYAFGKREDWACHLRRVGAAFGLAGLLLGSVIAAFQPARNELELATWFCISFIALCMAHSAWWMSVRAWRRTGRLTPNIVVVGATANAERLITQAQSSGEAAVLGVFDDRSGRAPNDIAGVPVLGDTDALIGHRVMPFVDRVVITVSSLARSRVRELIERLAVLPNEVMLFVDHDSEAGRAAALCRIVESPLARVSGEPSDERRALVKRGQDLVIGALAAILLAPVLVGIAIAIRLDSPGPILFRQRRYGFNNEQIVVWKFRSMREGQADPSCARQVCAGDDRVTRVGRFIRRTSLDELPQIINVLKGEMSLVGPRPHAVGMKTAGTESARLVATYAHRHRMKPGITGWAAIKGSRGPVETPEAVRRRVALDIEYIERQSFWLDLLIMVKTAPCLLGDAKVVR
jgi:Undecaprenyl-phosphate glucose phosphotransferase